MKINKLIFSILFLMLISITTYADVKKEDLYFDAINRIGTDKETKKDWVLIEEAYSSDNEMLLVEITRRLSSKLPIDKQLHDKIIPFLAKVSINNEYNSVRYDAIRDLKLYINNPEVIKALKKMLFDSDIKNRRFALKTLVESSVTEALPTLEKAIELEQDEEFKKEIMKGVEDLRKGKKEELNTIFRMLSDSNIENRKEAVIYFQVAHIEENQKQEVISHLLEAYKKEENIDVKMEILGSLSIIDIKNNSIKSLLEKEINNENEDISNFAKEILDASNKIQE